MRPARNASSAKRKTAKSGDRASRAIMGAVCAAMGLLAAAKFGRPALETWRADAWDETPCTILESRGEEAPNGRWRLAVRYRYGRGGAAFESDRWCAASEEKTVESVRERDALLAPFPAGAAAVCRVDPSDPARAVLSRDPVAVRDSLAGFAFGALLFFPVGLWMLASAVRGRPRARPAVRPDGKGAPHERAIAGVIGVLFFGAGVLVLSQSVPSFFAPRFVRGWTEAEAVVTRTDRTGGDRSGRYLAWAREEDGARYEDDTAGTGRRFDISGDAVPAAPPGAHIRVLVDPADPSRSILPPVPLRPAAHLVLLFPLVFLVIGAAAVWAAATGDIGESARIARRRRRARQGGGRTTVREAPGNSPATVMLVACNVFLLIFVGILFLPENAVELSVEGILFAGVFFAVLETVLGVAAFRELRRRRGPHLRIDLGGALPRPGARVAFSWRAEGRARELRGLRLELVGVVPSLEDTRSGSPSAYDEIHRETLFETISPLLAARGEGAFEIPAALPDDVDPFSVDWAILATGEVAGGLSLRDELPLPLATRNRAALDSHAESAESAEPNPHAESAEGAESESHAESAESKPHAESAESKSHAETAENAEN